MTAASKQTEDREPTEIEALLPFHAAGTLNLRDARRVEEALANDPDLARQYAVIQDEFAETILLNESLGAPSTRAMQKLFDAIDAEPARKQSLSFSPLQRISDFFSNLAPRTLAYSAIAGAALVLLQAGVIGTLVKGRSGGTFETASFQTKPAAGTYALIRFAPDATAADITKLLDTYKASIVSGPQAGMFRVRFGDTALPKQEAAQLLAKVQGEKIVSLVVAAE